MLVSLSISDFAIITTLEVKLRDGLTVLTGETGAGKSIMLDALSLLAGARADAGMVRAGAERAELAAEFELSKLKSVQRWLREQELDDEPPSTLQVRRVVRAEGSSKAWINGRAVPLTQLRELMEQLLEIHGQHDSVILQEPARQLAVLDHYADATELLQRAAESAAKIRQLTREATELKQIGGSGAELLELLKQQLQELKKLKLAPEHLAELDQKQRKLANADALIATVSQALEKLDRDAQNSIPRKLASLQSELQRHGAVDKKLSEAAALLDSALIEIEEAQALVEQVSSSLALDPKALADVEAELSRVHDLARKHRVPVPLLAEKALELEARVQQIGGADAQLEQLAKLKAQAIETWRQQAELLSQKRAQSGKKLSKAAETLIQELGMQGGKLGFELQPRGADEYAASGAESGEFFVCANPGQAMRPLRKTASGGELSRISLALKVASLKQAKVPVLLFDEVDAGIGGAVASTVGKLLAQLGRSHQVLVVTHLAQVAAFGDQHWKVLKQTAVSAGTTQTEVQPLERAARIDELARMLGGQVTVSTRAAASELHASARR